MDSTQVIFSLFGVGSVLLGWLHLRQSEMGSKLDDTYRKDEVKELIDLKNKPIIDAVDRNTQSQEQLAQAIQDLRNELMSWHMRQQHGGPESKNKRTP